jgi:glycosyltransferase involved in cell wall biosynthesis
VAPPVERKWFVPHVGDEFYLVVARLVPHKHVDIAIRACEQLGLPLVIAGSGRIGERLHKMAGPNVRFMGFVSDDRLVDLYSRARAVLVPSEEEFGLVALEAQAAGTPVIAFDAGGSKETVVDGVTGIRFAPQSVNGLVSGIERFVQYRWDRAAIQANAERFDDVRFRRDLLAVIDSHLGEPATHSMEAARA